MTTKEIKNYLIKIKADPKQRVARDNGGQYLDNLLFEFSELVKNKTIMEVVTELSKKLK